MVHLCRSQKDGSTTHPDESAPKRAKNEVTAIDPATNRPVSLQLPSTAMDDACPHASEVPGETEPGDSVPGASCRRHAAGAVASSYRSVATELGAL